MSEPLLGARFGPFAVGVFANGPARRQHFQRALIPTSDSPDLEVAIVSGHDDALADLLPQPRSDVHIASGDRYYAHWSPSPDPMLSVFDRHGRRGMTWFPEDAAPPWAVGQPLIPVIHAAAQETGWCVAHAAAIGRRGRFLLLPGPGKVGKSTAALACVRAGWDYAGDDFVLLNPGEGRVEPMFTSARLRQTGLSKFNELVAATTFTVSDDEGADRYELRLPFVPTGGHVAAIVLVRRTNSEPFVFRPVRGSEAVTAILRHSMARAPGYNDNTMRKLLSAANMAPSFSVDTGDDPAAIPAAFARLLEQSP